MPSQLGGLSPSKSNDSPFYAFPENKSLVSAGVEIVTQQCEVEEGMPGEGFHPGIFLFTLGP